MKSFIISLWIVLLSLVSYTDSLAGIKVEINMQLGRRSCDCCGHGFCYFSINVTNSDNAVSLKSENAGSGTISVENQNLIISVRKKSLTPETIKNHFSTGKFIMEENFTVPAEICEKLSIKNWTIPKGTYQIMQTPTEYIIKF
jgi:hypothetical protein